MALPKDFPTYAEDCAKAGGDPEKLNFILARRFKLFTEMDPSEDEFLSELAERERSICATITEIASLQLYRDAKFGRRAL